MSHVADPTQDDLAAARSSEEYRRPFTRSEPLVSVCIATFNRADLLVERCLPSLFRQTYSNIQIVIVGDRCTDDTEVRLAKLGDSRISFVNLPVRGPYPRGGRKRWLVAGTNAMNKALEVAEGDFTCHLDDDDQAVATRLEMSLEAARASTAEFVWHRFSCEFDNGIWETRGQRALTTAQVTTGSIFYHQFFRRIPWDINAFRLDIPGDWHRIQRILKLGPTTAFLRDVLLLHYREADHRQAVLLPGEEVLDEGDPPC